MMSLSHYHHLTAIIHHAQIGLQKLPFKLMGYLLLLLLILATLSTQQLEPSYSVANPQTIQYFRPSIIKNADLTLPLYLPIPEEITSVVEVILQNYVDCETVEVVPQVREGSFIEVAVNSSEIGGNNWMTEVMSFAFEETYETLYALLDNGSLIRAQPFSLSRETASQSDLTTYSKGSLGATDTWLTSQVQILAFRKEVFTLQAQQLSKVTFNPDGYWSKEMTPLVDNVVSVRIFNNTMFILTNSQLIAYNSTGTHSIRKEGKLQDFYYLQNTLYLLDKQAGLIQVEFGSSGQVLSECVWMIERLQWSRRLAGSGSTLMVLYEVNTSWKVANYNLNRYYHNYDQVRDIHLTTHYAVVDTYNQFIVMHHSINRHSFSILTPIEFIYKSNGTKISGIHLLPDYPSLSFIAGFKNKIQHLTMLTKGTTNGKNGINSMWVVCSKNQSGTLDVTTTFKGPCSLSSSASKYDCQVKVPMVLNFDYSHKRRQQRNRGQKMIVWVILFGLMFFSIVVYLACRRRLRAIQQKLKQQSDRLKERREQHSINMEQTFIPGT